ncbi:TIGR01244 family sulfur transferase [soil metagenome]
MNRKPVSSTIAIGDQPTEADLEVLKAEGYRGVVNLRHEGEPDQTLSPAEEEQRVRALGMDYLHVGIGGAPLTESSVSAVCEFLDKHADEPVLVHCKLGGRAAALVLLHKARAEGWDADEALGQGEAMGLQVTGKLRDLVEAYLVGHNLKG